MAQVSPARGEVWWYERPDQKPRPVLILTRSEAIQHGHGRFALDSRIAVIDLAEHAVHVMNLEQGRDDRAEGLGCQSRALAVGRERDPDLGGRRLIRQDVDSAIADELAARQIERGDLHPPPACRPPRRPAQPAAPPRRSSNTRLPRLVPGDIRVRSVRDEDAQVLRRQRPQPQALIGGDLHHTEVGGSAASSGDVLNPLTSG